MKKLRDLIDNAFITIQAIFGIAALCISAVVDNRELQLTFIETLLCMVVLDFYLVFTNRFKILTKSVQEIAFGLHYRGVGVEFVERHTFDWMTAVNSARHDVFISGTTLTAFVPGKDCFLGLNRRVSVRFLVLDVMNVDTLEGFRRMRYADPNKHSQQRYLNQANLFKDLCNALKEKPNISFGVADRITPMAFVAIDVKRLSENSMIRVQHYLHESEADQATVSYVVRPGSPVYALYAQQISILWDAANTTGTYLDQP